MPMALASLVLPFYVGAAVLSLLFPLCVLLACDTDVDRAHGGLVLLTSSSWAVFVGGLGECCDDWFVLFSCRAASWVGHVYVWAAGCY
jgi:hypothetical protein